LSWVKKQSLKCRISPCIKTQMQSIRMLRSPTTRTCTMSSIA
jgi:hypothetical protein